MKIHPVSQESPDMPDAEFKELVDDIQKNGQLVPIWKMGDEIIDGRKRLRACQVLGIEPKTIEVNGGNDPAEIARSLNLLRTHYTESQRAMFAATMATWQSGTHKSDRRIVDNSVDDDKLTVAEAAKRVGVGLGTVAAAKRVRREAHPDILRMVEEGKLPVTVAARISRLPQDEQLAAAKQNRKAKGENRTRWAQRRKPKNSPDEAIDRCTRDIGIALETISERLPFAKDLTGAVDALKKHRTQLTQIIKEMEE